MRVTLNEGHAQNSVWRKLGDTIKLVEVTQRKNGRLNHHEDRLDMCDEVQPRHGGAGHAIAGQ